MTKLLASASIVCILLVVLGANRGFDISDEGLYVLLTDPLQENVAGIFNYDLFFKALHKISGYTFGVVELRIFRLLTYLAAALALAGFWKNINKQTGLDFEIFWICFLCLMAGYAFLPPTLSYNSLTVVLICWWLMIVSSQRISWRSVFCLGTVLSLLIYIKITLALIFFPLTILVLFFQKKITPVQAIFLIIPLIIFEQVFLIFFEENAFIRLSDGISQNSLRPGYEIGFMIKSIGVGGLWTGVSGLIFYFIGIFKISGRVGFKFILMVGLFGVMGISCLKHIGGEMSHLVLIGSSAVLGFCFGLKQDGFKVPRFWVAFLFVLPFILHFGSNVYWLRIGIHYWVFWILGFMLCFENLRNWTTQILCPLSVLLIFNGIWWHPFGQEEPLWAEKMPWKRGGRETIHLDQELLGVLDKLEENGIANAPNPILAAYRIPGLVWLAGGQTAFSPGIWDKSQLDLLFPEKPSQMVYSGLQVLPSDWIFGDTLDLGTYQKNHIILLWDQ